MLEITVTKITGNRNKVWDDLYAIEIYFETNENSQLLIYLRNFFRYKTKYIGHEIFNQEYLIYLYSVNTEIKNSFISYLTEIVFSDKFNYLLHTKEVNKLRIVYLIEKQ